MGTDKSKINPSIGTIFALFLLAGMFIYLTITMALNDRLERDLSNERLKSELLLSEKLVKEKENLQLEGELKEKKQEYSLNNAKLKSALDQLTYSQKDIKMTKVLSSEKLIHTQKQEIHALTEKIKRDSIDNVIILNQLKTYSAGLESSVSTKSTEASLYIQEIERLRRLIFNGIKIEALRKNNSSTFKASKTKKIRVELQVSDYLKNLTFQITDPSETSLLINEANSSIVTNASDNQSSVQAFFIDPETQLKAIEKFKTVEIVYTATNKLLPGIYKITLLAEQEMIGNCFLRLE